MQKNKNISDIKSIPKSQLTMQTLQSAESLEFGGIFFSDVNPKWFEWLMQNSSKFLFSIALVLFILKFSISTYQFIKEKNKNLNKSAALIWNAIQTMLIGVAILGTLTAATAFLIATPALFFSVMAADMLRNICLLGWHTIKYFQVKDRLKNATDELTITKYEILAGQYKEKIKENINGTVISFSVTLAVLTIFLLPQVGVSTATIFAVGTFNFTVAAFAGIVSAAVLSTLSFIPNLFSAGKWGFTKLIAKPHPAHTKDNPADEMDKPFLSQSSELKMLKGLHHNPKLVIDNNEKLNTATEHKLAFTAYSHYSAFRETIIEHITTKELAETALNKMLTKKISQLKRQLDESDENGFYFFNKLQEPKRLQKLHALLLLKQQLNNEILEEEIFNPFKTYFKNFNNLEKKRCSDLPTLLMKLELTFPAIKKSFKLNQSDTQNIFEAFKVYIDKCKRNEFQDFVPEIPKIDDAAILSQKNIDDKEEVKIAPAL